MSKTYRVFLGAPSFADIQRDPTSYSWRTFSSSSSSDTTPLSRKPTRLALHADQSSCILGPSQNETNGSALGDVDAPAPSQVQSASVILSADLLETASERISMIYKDAIFGVEDEESVVDKADDGQLISEEKEVETSVFHGADQSSVFTWPSTSDDLTDTSASRMNLNEDPSLMPRPTPPAGSEPESPAKSPQEFSTTQPESQSFGIHSWTSSISRFPAFNFSLHSLSSLSSLSAQAEAGMTNFTGKFTQKVNLLLAVLEIEGPDTIRIKRGADAGNEVSILKIILGDEENNVCKLTAWREVAEEWGDEGAKRGDVVYLERVMATCEPATSITLTASSYLKSALTICYRTMPLTVQDGKLRPDLRLATSEPCVRRVSGVVRWFERMAGLH